MEKEKKPGKMELLTMAATKKAKKMDLEVLLGPTDPSILVILRITASKAKVNTLGKMVVSTSVNGKPIKCTEKESLSGSMEKCTGEITTKTKSKDREFLHGQTDVNTKASGSTANKMVKECSSGRTTGSTMACGMTAFTMDLDTTAPKESSTTATG
jgi:hypothetical protein